MEGISTFIVANEGVTAGAVMRALEREGLDAHGTWGPFDAVAEPSNRAVQLIVVVEPNGIGYPESDYALLRTWAPEASVVAICSADRDRPQSLLWAGVDGIVFEPGADAIVGTVARAVLAGHVVAPQALRAAIQPPPLTRRERQMLEMVVEGLTNHEIAERLYLAESTVKRHLSSTFRRLGVNSRREAVAVVLAGDDNFMARPTHSGEEHVR